MFFNNSKLYASLAVIGTLALGAPSVAHAQMKSQQAPQANTQMQMQGDQQTAASFSEDKIDAYINAAMEVSKIHVSTAPQIKAAESKQEKTALYKDMQTKMVGAIQGTEGITVKDYNRISKAAEQDQQLAMMIRNQLKAKKTTK